MQRLTISALLVLLLAPGGTIPAGARPTGTDPQEPHTLTGTYQTTNPIYPMVGAITEVVLYDMAGQIHEDYAFLSPPDTQVLGTCEGDIVSGTYQIDLPETPCGTLLDFDSDPATPAAVQVFVAGTYVNFLGDRYINRGESLLTSSVRQAPLSQAVIGGYVVVWTDHEGAAFPAGMGPDGKGFTGDEPLMTLPAGWSVVSLETDPFTIIRQATVSIPIVESFGALNDYSALSYEDAWRQFFRRTQETYPFTQDKQLDWDAIDAEITPLVQAATNDLEFHLAIVRFGELIPDTHISYVSLPLVQAFLMGGIGFQGLVVTDDDEVVVIGVNPNTPADQAGIQADDVLIEVDGTLALEALDQTPLLMSSASTPQGRRYWQAMTMLQGAVGSEVTLTWQSGDGSQHTQTLTRVVDIGPFLQALADSDPSAPVIDARMLDSGIGYIRVRGFAEDISRADSLFGQALQGLIDAGAKGIILDVRNNSGGLVNLAMAIAGRFFTDYRRIVDFYYADGEGGFAYRGYVEILTGEPTYGGPVAILVNEMTGSAGDVFVYAMQTDHRAIIVGNSPTGGFAGEISDGQYLLPGGLQIQIPTGRPVDPVTGKTVIEGTGITPDIRVPLTRASLISPEDEVLETAQAAILAQ